jgi:RNA polymerase sigma-70 factor (ECF subfamily)
MSLSICCESRRGDIIKTDTSFVSAVKKARRGDTDAFAELYAAVYKDLYRIAVSNLKNRHDASDAVSDAVLEAFASVKNLRDEHAFKAWIIKILTVKIKGKQKEYAKANNYRLELDSLDDAELRSREDTAFDNVELTEALGKLKEDERLILTLGVVSGYKSEEIAKIVGMSANTVRSKTARAKIKLRGMLT